MKMKIMLCLFALIAILLLFGCAAEPAELSEREVEKERFDDSHYSIIEDSETGCRYLEFNGINNGGVTVLMKSDGTPDCGN